MKIMYGLQTHFWVSLNHFVDITRKELKFRVCSSDKSTPNSDNSNLSY